MKTAIILTGHMRTFARCLDNLHWFVFRHFPDADFFVSTIKDAQSGSAELLRAKYPKARVEIEVVDHQPELPLPLKPYAPDWTLGRMYSHEPYAISVHPQAVLRQLWQLERGWAMANARVNEGLKEAYAFQRVYGLVVRCRPDLWFRSCGLPLFVNLMVNPHPKSICETDGSQAWCPWWGRFGGCNDRFAILGTKAAEAYFTTYSRIPKLIADGCPLHPESLVAASLQDAGCTIYDTMRAEFSTLRMDGTFRDPEITMVDIAHLAASR